MINNYNLNDKDFNNLRDIIYNEAGIKLSDVKKVLMQSRLIKRLRDLQLENFTQYYDYLIENYENPPTETEIKNIHKILMQNLLKNKKRNRF